MNDWKSLLARYYEIRTLYLGEKLTFRDGTLNLSGTNVKHNVRSLFFEVLKNDDVATMYLKATGYDVYRKGLKTSNWDAMKLLDIMEDVVILSAMFEGESLETIVGTAELHFHEGVIEENYARNKMVECAAIAKLAGRDYPQKERAQKFFGRSIDRYIEGFAPKTKE